MQFSPEEYRLLAGRRFNEILAADEEMKSLQAQQYDRSAETRVLLEVLGVTHYSIGGLPVRPLTAARWAFLWMLESPFITGENPSDAQTDAALYVLSLPDLRKMSCGLSDIPAGASGYSAATGLSMEEIREAVGTIIHTAFLPLSLLPPSGSTDHEEARFDGLWVTRIAGIAARESGMSFDACLHEMSLSCACCLYVNWLQRESPDPKEIRRRPNADIEIQIERRFKELANEFLAECRT